MQINIFYYFKNLNNINNQKIKCKVRHFFYHYKFRAKSRKSVILSLLNLGSCVICF